MPRLWWGPYATLLWAPRSPALAPHPREHGWTDFGSLAPAAALRDAVVHLGSNPSNAHSARVIRRFGCPPPLHQESDVCGTGADRFLGFSRVLGIQWPLAGTQRASCAGSANHSWSKRTGAPRNPTMLELIWVERHWSP